MGAGMTAMLVAPEDARGRPDGLTATIAREEIEEALASDAPLDLVLDVARPGETEPTSVTVSWERDDLEALISRFESDIMLAFDPAEIERALTEDFEGHGFREMVVFTVAAASASAALAAGTASGQLLDAGGGGGAAAAVVAPGHGEATTARDLATAAAPDVDVAISTAMAAKAAPDVDVAISTAMNAAAQGAAVGTGDATTARDLAAPVQDEATLVDRGIADVASTADEAGLAARGIEPSALPAGHDEATLASRGIGVTPIATEEAGLAARGIDPQGLPASHDEATLVQRGVETPPVVDSGSSFELPSVDSGTAAAIGGLAGAGLVIVAAGFLARRQRPGAA